MKYWMVAGILALAACGSESAMAPTDVQPAHDAVNGCKTAAHAACTGQNPSKHNP